MARPFSNDAEFYPTTNYIQFGNGQSVIIDDARSVFEGEYERAGRDLQITGPDGTVYKVIDYFAVASPPAILTTSGATLSGETVEALAGPAFAGQYAQAGKSVVAAGKLVNIGKVQTLDGEATIKRADGSVVKLKVGEQVFQGDVVETAKGGKVSITFTDGSIFAVSESARMVLDKLVYDPGGSSNSMLFNLIQGTFSFIAGKIASTGKMEVETPVATMGIRGTTVVASVEAASGATRFSLVNDPDGTTGRFSIFHKQTGALIGSLTSTDKSLFVRTITSPPLEIPRDAASEQSAVDLIYRAYQDFQRRGDVDVDNNQNPLVQKASYQSSGISDQPDPSDPLQSFQGSSVNNIAPLGDTSPIETLPGGNEAPTSISDETPDTTPLTPAAEDPGPPVPQPPVFNVPTLTLNVSEDGSVNVTGFTLSASNNNPITVTITAQSTVTLASTVGLQFITGDGTDDETMTFIGAPQDIENALNGLTYFPTPNNDGDGGLTIELDDGQFVVVADIDVDITPVADDPTANDDNFATVEGVPVNGDVTADNGNGVDFEPDAGDSFTVTELNGIPAAIGVATTLASGAIVTLQSDGTFSFAPSNVAAPGSVVNDSFTYTIEDTTGRTDSATVTIAVTGQTNEPPEVTTNSFGPDLLAGANGGFESGTFGTDFFVVQPGSGNLPNWTVSGGDVDHITTAWVSSEGNRSLDLHGTPSSGGVSTDIATTAGKAYLVTFDLAGNPIAGNTTNNIRVAADGTNQDFSFTEPVGASVSNLGWATKQFLFEATDSSTTLSFTSLDAASEGGPTLDNVRVQEINNVAAANQPTAITGISITDPDIGGLDLVVTLSTSNGTLTVNDGVANGLIASQIVNTAPGTVVLTGTLAALTATLSDANAVSYQANTGFSGLDTITVTASDQGNGGSGPALADTETLSVYVQPPSSIVTDEDFEGGATGWLAVNGTTYPSYVDNKTDATEPAAFTEFLGQFGDSNGNEGIQKTYSLSGTQDSVTIKFDFYEINSWDGNFVIPNEVFNVFIAGGLVISDVHDLTQLGLSRDHAEATASPALLGFPNSLDLTPSNFFSQDQIWSYEFTIETNASSLSLGFGAELDRPFSELEDESFGIDNLTIVENSDTLNGTAGSDVLRDGDGAFDVIQADAGNDIVILEATVDTADTFNPNFTQVDGGTGQDILQLADAGSLDLTAIGPTALNSFETIDLNTTTANTLTINVDDVQGISETTNTSLDAALSGLTGTFSTQNNLLVLGNNADTVNLVDAAGGGWTDTGETVGIGGQNYSVINYTLADGSVEATAAIDSDVTKTGLNTSPTLAATVLGAATFNENIVNASEQSFIDNAAVSDAEGNFNGGTLVVSGLTIDDHVTVAHQGYGTGQIGYDSGAISYENTDIGVVGVESDQTGSGEDLHITLNASATTQSIEALVEALVYGTGNTAFDPNNTSALTVTLTDAAGASASQMIGINVIAQAEDTLTQPGGVSYFGDDTIVGTSGADVFHGLQGNDLLIGNGGADELRGGIGNDIIAVSDANFELVQGFDGVDTLRLDGGLDLDLTGLSNLRVQSIEAIDLQAASGANTLTLDVYDVFDLSDTVNTDLSNALGSQLPGLNISTTENLVISGGSGDKVNLVAAAADGSWQDTGSTVNVGGENHAVYNYANTAGEVLATVAIETDVTTDTGSGGVIS